MSYRSRGRSQLRRTTEGRDAHIDSASSSSPATLIESSTYPAGVAGDALDAGEVESESHASGVDGDEGSTYGCGGDGRTGDGGEGVLMTGFAGVLVLVRGPKHGIGDVLWFTVGALVVAASLEMFWRV